jgi:fructosamine-3-kinase
LEKSLGKDPGPIAFSASGGGCINTAATFDAFGETFFVKWNDRPLPRQFEAEAAGLLAMRAADSGLRIPQPIAHSDAGPGASFLVLEFLPPGRRGAGFEEALGQGLATLHQCASQRGHGFSVDGYCGATPQPNGWMADWIPFYSQRRLGHQLRLARNAGLTTGDARIIESVINRLPELLAPGEFPSLIHGDLWSGNLHVAPDGSPGLIDPAAYFGHREAELGMMVLFGGFSQRVFSAYEESWPLEPGWRDRLDLYTLYHVLNHFNLFGGGYGRQAVALARRYS